jgi:hypothetical protein
MSQIIPIGQGFNHLAYQTNNINCNNRFKTNNEIQTKNETEHNSATFKDILDKEIAKNTTYYYNSNPQPNINPAYYSIISTHNGYLHSLTTSNKS